jgi:hypothetical protein
MRLIEIFTDVLTALILASFVCGIFLLFGNPLFPPRYAKMVLLPGLDAMTTASSRMESSATLSLPDSVDFQVQKRPGVEKSAGASHRAIGLE